MQCLALYCQALLWATWCYITRHYCRGVEVCVSWPWGLLISASGTNRAKCESIDHMQSQVEEWIYWMPNHSPASHLLRPCWTLLSPPLLSYHPVAAQVGFPPWGPFSIFQIRQHSSRQQKLLPLHVSFYGLLKGRKEAHPRLIDSPSSAPPHKGSQYVYPLLGISPRSGGTFLENINQGMSWECAGDHKGGWEEETFWVWADPLMYGVMGGRAYLHERMKGGQHLWWCAIMRGKWMVPSSEMSVVHLLNTNLQLRKKHPSLGSEVTGGQSRKRWKTLFGRYPRH